MKGQLKMKQKRNDKNAGGESWHSGDILLSPYPEAKHLKFIDHTSQKFHCICLHRKNYIFHLFSLKARRIVDFCRGIHW